MKKATVVILILITGLLAYSKTNKFQVDSLNIAVRQLDLKIDGMNQTVENLSNQMDLITYTVNAQKDIISQEQSAIENSMNSISVLLTIFSIALSLGGIALGWYINRKENNMRELLNKVETKKAEVERLEEKASKTKDEIVKLNDDMTNDIEGLYTRLRREETVTLLKRLVYEPNDIGNLATMLLSRELEDSDFKYVLLAYRNLENRENDDGIERQGFLSQLSSKGHYLVLFYQHFCGQAINNELVRDDLIKFIPKVLKAAFKKDIDKSTNSLIGCLNSDNFQGEKNEILYKYIQDLGESKFKEYEKPYEIIVSKYKNETELQTVCKRLLENNILIPCFLELLCERFKDDNIFINLIREKQILQENA